MCGIVAIINKSGEPGSTTLARQMSDVLRHRGPDGEGQWARDNVALGHRRLSIIDLTDGGSQPMQTADGRFTLSYNGEIYNFQDLKLELKAQGVKFVSRSDSEVVLQAIAHWGIQAAASRFNGIFALVCYDSLEKTLLVARDRYGIKPLYVCQTPDHIFLASEVKAFKGHPAFSAKMDAEGLVEYFTFQNFLSRRTLFAGVTMFPAGHTACIRCADNCQVDTEEYWDFRFEEPEGQANHEDMKSELLFLFEQAVSRQMVSDVGVSCYLSGGMDSGSITAVAAGLTPKMRTFTCGFDLTSATGAELNFDERRLAERMSYLFGTEQYEVVLKSGDMERAIPDLVYHLDEPRVGQSYPNYYVAGLASRFGKVVLGGTGGDELFGGYPWRYYQAVGAHDLDEFCERYFGFWQRMIRKEQMQAVFAPVWGEVKHVDTFEIFRSVLERHPVDFRDPSSSLNLALYFEAKTFLHGLLTVEDKLSMAHSMESRVPFLDNDLVNFAMRIPGHTKVRDLHKVASMNRQNRELGTEGIRQFQKTNDGKLLLRQMMADLLPGDIVEAQKQGFSAPDASWFRGESVDYVKKSLLRDDAGIYAFLDRDAVGGMLDDHLAGRENRRLLVWSLLCVNELANIHEMS